MGLSWEGPLGGALLVYDKDKELIAKRGIGYIKKLYLKDLTGDRISEIVCETTPGTGTGWRLERIEVYSLRNEELKDLFLGVSFEGNWVNPPVVPDGPNELEAKFSFEDIDNDGNLEIIRYPKKTFLKYNKRENKYDIISVKELPKEIYKWDTEKQHFCNIKKELGKNEEVERKDEKDIFIP